MRLQGAGDQNLGHTERRQLGRLAFMGALSSSENLIPRTGGLRNLLRVQNRADKAVSYWVFSWAQILIACEGLENLEMLGSKISGSLGNGDLDVLVC